MVATYHIVTFGCQMNDYDSQMMEGILAARGWQRAAAEAQADVVLYNTCVVREHAESRALARLDQLRRLKADRPGMVLGVTGCMAQKDAERLLERLPHVDLVLGTRAIARLSPLLDRILATGQPQVCVDILDEAYPGDVVPVRQRPLKAPVNIIFGCNKNCSYCIVPRTRGREQSRPAPEIEQEVARLVAHGCREVTLVGQNVNSYRWQSAEGGGREGLVDFGALLRRASAAMARAVADGDGPGAWLRYITSHPRDCNEGHIAAVAECENIADNFHLPVQAGSSAVLHAMRRGYTRERYLALVERVRAAVPGATLTTDLIVGFPGESDADYEQTLELVREVRFDSAYMYLYSPRPGTPAAEEFTDHIPIEVKKERLARLIELQERISLEVNQALIGRTLTVLIEDRAPRTPGGLLARTRGDKMVVVPGPEAWIGRFIEVTIESASGHTLLARPAGVAAVYQS